MSGKFSRLREKQMTSRCGKKFHEYEKQQGGRCVWKGVSQSESRRFECGQVLQGFANQGKVLGFYSK